MARILVAGAHETLAERRLLSGLSQRMRRDGHDAAVFGAHDERVDEAARDCDAAVAVLDRAPADAAALVAYLHAAGKPVLGLSTAGLAPPGLLVQWCQHVPAKDEAAWLEALPAFYEAVRPFAGRVVRDRIPDLVKEAGHDVRFRKLGDDERPRFLKQKVHTEAKELLAADLASEKEEVADLLEALEAFIAARGFPREDLRRIKEHKRKQRGGFERCFVVEATASQEDASQEDSGSDAQEPAAQAPQPTETVASGEAVDFEYGAEEPPPERAPEDLAPGRDVKARFFEL